MLKTVFVLVVLGILAIGGFLVLRQFVGSADARPGDGPRTPPLVACTADAKLCPDGSSVGRDSARHCAFAPCPNEGRVAGTVTLAPTCPYERVFDKPCPTAPYDGDLVLAPQGGGAVTRVEVYGGKFYATLAAGTYEISSGRVLPNCGGQTFAVLAGEETTSAASCDSGIR